MVRQLEERHEWRGLAMWRDEGGRAVQTVRLQVGLARLTASGSKNLKGSATYGVDPEVPRLLYGGL